MFQEAINVIGLKLKKDFYLKELRLVSTGLNTYNLILIANPLKRTQPHHLDPPPAVHFSSAFKQMFSMEKMIYYLDWDNPLIIELVIAPTENDPNQHFRTLQVSKRLTNNYFPTPSLLVAEINKEIGKAMVEIAIERNASEKIWNFFSCHAESGYVSFNKRKGFDILLDPAILKMFHLPNDWLEGNTAGTHPAVMKTYKRNYFYVHCDCLDYYYLNSNVSDIIRVVKNESEPDEKTIISVQNPQYYAVSRRFLSNINMYVTDGLFENILQFDKEIVYTLHFRKCLPSS